MNKAYIVEQIDDVSYRVRIPEYHKLRGTLGCTKDADLPIAYVCTTPGVFPTYDKGEVVWVNFENNQLGNPVIIGSLLIKDSINKGSAIFCDQLTAEGDVALPENTSLGTLTWKNFSYLEHIGGIIDDISSSSSDNSLYYNYVNKNVNPYLYSHTKKINGVDIEVGESPIDKSIYYSYSNKNVNSFDYTHNNQEGT